MKENGPTVIYHTTCGRFVAILTTTHLCLFDKLEGNSVTTTLSDAILVLRGIQNGTRASVS